MLKILDEEATSFEHRSVNPTFKKNTKSLVLNPPKEDTVTGYFKKKKLQENYNKGYQILLLTQE